MVVAEFLRTSRTCASPPSAARQKNTDASRAAPCCPKSRGIGAWVSPGGTQEAEIAAEVGAGDLVGEQFGVTPLGGIERGRRTGTSLRELTFADQEIYRAP